MGDSGSKTFDLIVLGHFSIDFILLPGLTKPKKMLGGPPTYTSLAAKKMDARVSVISKVGGDFPIKYVEWLRKHDVDLCGLKRHEEYTTTSFMLKYYSRGERALILRSRAPPITSEDLSTISRAKAIHISPIANEITLDLISEVSDAADLKSLDPQGLLRRFNNDGKVSLHRINDLSFLEKINVFKSSEKEVKVLAGKENVFEALRKVREHGANIAIATMSDKGSLISFNNKFFMVPAVKPKIFLDPTGAGDAFIGAFMAEYLRGEDPLWCACVGSAAASFVIEKIGPRGFRGRREVYKRASPIYEKTLIVR